MLSTITLKKTINIRNINCFGLLKMLFLIVLLVPFLAIAQPLKCGSVEYLKYCNGIGGLKLGADINQIPGYKLTYLNGDNKLDVDSCLKFEYKDEDMLKMENDLNLDLIGIRTYKNKIVNIYLFFKWADSYLILKNFLTAYGVFTAKPNDYEDVYNWNSSKLSLSLRYPVKLDFGVATFTSTALAGDIELMKEKRKALMKNLFALAFRYLTGIITKTSISNFRLRSYLISDRICAF